MSEEKKTALASVAPVKRVSLVQTMANAYGLEEAPFLEAIKQTVMPGNATMAQTAAFLQVANKYSLNPFIKEIYAFPTKGGGIMPMISIDGWLSIANRDARFDGYEYEEIRDEKGQLEGGQITVYRNDRQRAFTHREWFTECKRNTEPWNNMPRRMMENRTTAQGIRRALGISGVVDSDEAEAMQEINITGQSTVLERSTENKTAALKEKIGARKGKEEPKPAAPEPEPAPVVEVAPEPAAEAVIEPAPVVPPAEKVTKEDRKAFLTLAQEKAVALGLNEEDAKKRIREVLFDAGFTKFDDVPKTQFPALLDAVRAWA